MRKKKAEAPKLTESDRAYIKENATRMDLNGLAAAVEKPADLVKEFVATLPAPKKKLKFQQKAGTVAMTEAQSAEDDGAPRGPNREFYREMRGCCHVFEPGEPIT